MNKLLNPRDYQLEINQAVNTFLLGKAIRGQVYSPTGSGKTECFIWTVNELATVLKENKVQDKLNICVVHPRLALSQEQLTRFQQTFGDRFTYDSFHSGRHIQGETKHHGCNTTNVDTLLRIIANTDRTHITFCSYDSLHKLRHIEFDLMICDEAHNLVRAEYTLTLALLKAKKILFYTATPIIDELTKNDPESGLNKGMTSRELFGDVIMQVSPLRLMKRGYIVPPIMHFLTVDTDKSGDGVDTTQIVAEAWKHQKMEIEKHNMPYMQLLVASRGIGDHRKIEEEIQFLWRSIGEQVDVFVIEHNRTRQNNRPCFGGNNRFQTLQHVKQSGKNAIIMHYDTLAEGIDVSTITGVCVLRNLSKAKLLQTIGRAGRPYIGDLNELFEVIDMTARRKPHCVVTLPVVDGEHIGGIDAQRIVEAFISGGYGDLRTYVTLTERDERIVAEIESAIDLGQEEVNNSLSTIVATECRREVQKLLEIGFSV